MFDLVGEVYVFGNGWGVVVNIHAVDVLLHFKCLLVHVVRRFGILSAFGAQTGANVSHLISKLEIINKFLF